VKIMAVEYDRFRLDLQAMEEDIIEMRDSL